jgi:hypothetical protein
MEETCGLSPELTSNQDHLLSAIPETPKRSSNHPDSISDNLAGIEFFTFILILIFMHHFLYPQQASIITTTSIEPLMHLLDFSMEILLTTAQAVEAIIPLRQCQGLDTGHLHRVVQVDKCVPHFNSFGSV